MSDLNVISESSTYESLLDEIYTGLKSPAVKKMNDEDPSCLVGLLNFLKIVNTGYIKPLVSQFFI